MALPPKFKAHRLLLSPSATSTEDADVHHTLEIYFDYVCPYSSKLFNTLYTQVLPALETASPRPTGPLQIILRQQIQPWHPSSTLTHEAALAVLRLTSSSPQKFWSFTAALLAAQRDYFDVNVVSEPRNTTYRRLAKLAASSVDVDEEEVYKLLAVPDRPAEDGSLNVGNAVTNDLKLLVRLARQSSVHVSPTVLFNGLVVNEISSGWTKDQWIEWLGKNVV
ncbi:hypothetical protein QBC47DRAFT_375806 [Echria macrotheca]|uniref:Thioredoxin-like fold domain-containing protein n=1 Tax=Echria macrotheca TaxID=438768 RepID=A0AAJ0BFK1_9PEZI|nr:hypothetical protein QBC47DRAFT_375806 [Echria macrotheca]